MEEPQYKGRYRGVFFDFDGTLADSFQAIADSANHVRSLHGLPALPEPQIRRFVGRGLIYLLENIVDNLDEERDIAAYHEHHPSVMFSQTRLLPGAGEAVRRLKGAGLKIAVCSNKPVEFTRALVEQLGLAASVALVLGPEDVAQPKPAPDMILAALRSLQLESKEALYVGDMVIDIETSRSAGVDVWVVPTGTADRQTLLSANPNRLIDSLEQLPELLIDRNDS